MVAQRLIPVHKKNGQIFNNARILPYKVLIGQFPSDHPWAFWTAYYSQFILTAFVCALVFSTWLNPNHTDVNSARLLLSALIQAEATIIALVITLTLVAVQLTSASFTPRVAHIFARSPHMYLLLAIYIIAIAYSALLLQLLNGIEGSVVQSMEIWISWGYWLTVLLAIALIPYIYNILELFRPETIIKRLTRNISRDTILNHADNDFLTSVFDITHNSIMKYDTATIRYGLNMLTARINDQVSENNTLAQNSEMVKIYGGHLERCARQAIDLHDEEILTIILDQFEKTGIHCADSRFDNPTWQIITIISEVEKLIAVKDIPESLNRVRELIRVIGKISIENNFSETPFRIMVCQETIAKHAIDKINPLDRFSRYAAILENSIESLTEFTSLGISTGQLATMNGSLGSLKSIGDYSIRQDIFFPLYSIADKVFDLWLTALPCINSTSSFLEVSGLALVAKKDTIKKYSVESNVFEQKIMEIGILSMQKSSEPEQQGVARLLANMRMIDDKNFQDELASTNMVLHEDQKEPYRKFLALQESIYQEMAKVPPG
jgi:hypothetical protein